MLLVCKHNASFWVTKDYVVPRSLCKVQRNGSTEFFSTSHYWGLPLLALSRIDCKFSPWLRQTWLSRIGLSLSLSLDIATTEWPIEFIIDECSTEFDHSFSETEKLRIELDSRNSMLKYRRKLQKKWYKDVNRFIYFWQNMGSLFGWCSGTIPNNEGTLQQGIQASGSRRLAPVSFEHGKSTWEKGGGSSSCEEQHQKEIITSAPIIYCSTKKHKPVQRILSIHSSNLGIIVSKHQGHSHTCRYWHFPEVECERYFCDLLP